jgi:uncharacterized membrane protein YidH (DUF202 family)
MTDPAGASKLRDEAAERTLLSWQRTAIGGLVIAALVVRAGLVERQLAVAVPCAVLLVLGAAAEWRLSLRIHTRGAHVEPQRSALLECAALVVTGVCAIAAGASLALALAS